MQEEKGFTVHDRRGVKKDPESTETEQGREPTGAGAGRAESTGRPLPPVDFAGFVLGLGQMALVHLGEIPVPGTEEMAMDLEQARHSIDILDMLEAKTRGNLTPDEETLLRTLEGELKLKYVRVGQSKPG